MDINTGALSPGSPLPASQWLYLTMEMLSLSLELDLVFRMRFGSYYYER
jgi:hypothetical protein